MTAPGPLKLLLDRKSRFSADPDSIARALEAHIPGTRVTALADNATFTVTVTVRGAERAAVEEAADFYLASAGMTYRLITPPGDPS